MEDEVTDIGETLEKPLLSVSSVLSYFASLCLLWFFADWRETHSFWTDKGGYPLWLRDLVQIGFYPLLTWCGAKALWETARLTQPNRGIHLTIPLRIYISLIWFCLFAIGFRAFSNNISNYVEGQPIHSHTINTETGR